MNSSASLTPGALGADNEALLDAIAWRKPTVTEVFNFLTNPNPTVRANSVAYLQHLTYMNDEMKKQVRLLGGIPILIDLLCRDVVEVQRNVCGALRNLSYGRKNDENKLIIRDSQGIQALVQTLVNNPDNEIRELSTSVLWNLSSCEDVKWTILDEALNAIVTVIIVPYTFWLKKSMENDNQFLPFATETHWFTVYRNATGMIRNISSAGSLSRKQLRDCDSLIESLLFLIGAAIEKNDIDNKLIENCICILRNLSYRCQETLDPSFEKNLTTKSLSSSSSMIRTSTQINLSSSTLQPANISEIGKPVKGQELLWQPDIVKLYLAILSGTSNNDTKEAAAGAIQNLAACSWQPSVDIRSSVRKEKGLPILVELLRAQNDKVVCAAATALRNLTIDQKNKELIGKYAIPDLVSKLPNGQPDHDKEACEGTVASVLATLHQVLSYNADFAKSFYEFGGLDRLNYIQKSRNKFSTRIQNFNSQVLIDVSKYTKTCSKIAR